MHMLSAQPPAISYFFSPALPMVFFIQKQLLTGFSTRSGAVCFDSIQSYAPLFRTRSLCFLLSEQRERLFQKEGHRQKVCAAAGTEISLDQLRVQPARPRLPF